MWYLMAALDYTSEVFLVFFFQKHEAQMSCFQDALDPR